MAKVVILKSFAYGGAAGTRATTVHLAAGPDEVEILDALVPGLIHEGFVKRAVLRPPKQELPLAQPDNKQPRRSGTP